MPNFYRDPITHKLTLKFYTKRGKLTRYAFACGYLEHDGPFTLSLEHGVYIIKGLSDDGYHAHQTTRRLSDARCILRTVGHIYGRLPINRHIVVPRHSERWQRNEHRTNA